MDAEPLRVLVVDDEPSILHALRILFEVHGIPARSATNPEDAMRAIAAGDVGVIVQDMNFGADKTSGEQGVRLFRRIRQADPEVPVVLMTAWASLETAVTLIKEGANDYLAKPWDDDKLVLTVRNLLRLRTLQLENERLQQQGRHARDLLAARYELCGLIYESEEMQHLVSLAVHVASSDAPVLITGPSGVGKEKLAEIVQANSRRRDRPFLRVNVGALPDELMESELFGAEAGAYTGSKGLRVGHFEAADGGTLFLDEIDALSLAGQIKLLRVVQSGEFQRLGSSRTRRVDVRLISASNADLRRAIADGRFRDDLYFRLNVIELALPPLVDRPQDILPLARAFLARAAEARADAPSVFDAEAEAALICHDWGGNVRELENRIRRAGLTAAGGSV
ncbi:MAG TPA: sigma-54 dependent transcriptional regulator, partial [Candidatus Polarisedimenticolaceae bacterium]|nr:sigma-54 dependent transcriptional regulator [Candidatus Polarisedimenticolaceae bacterium]